MLEKLRKNKKLLKFVIEKLFTFSDLDSKYEGIDSSIGNIYCPFHDNFQSPSAKMYYDEKKDIQVIHCFTEHKNFTSYNYLTKVLGKEPYEYLIQHRKTDEIISIIEAVEKGYVSIQNSLLRDKINYINNLYNECNFNLESFIEKLYNS